MICYRRQNIWHIKVANQSNGLYTNKDGGIDCRGKIQSGIIKEYGLLSEKYVL